MRLSRTGSVTKHLFCDAGHADAGRCPAHPAVDPHENPTIRASGPGTYGTRGDDADLGLEEDDFILAPGCDDIVCGLSDVNEPILDAAPDCRPISDENCDNRYGDDRAYGGGNDDSISAFVGVDRIFGGNGNDELYAGSVSVGLHGQAVNDFLVTDVGRDSDRCLGERGLDREGRRGGSDVFSSVEPCPAR